MSTSTTRRQEDHPGQTMWSTTAVIFGGAVLGIVGVFQVLEGISAVSKDQLYVRGISYTYKIDVTAWGWIHILLGAVAVLVAVGLFLDWPWARYAGIAIAVLGAIANFAFVPYYPLWAIVTIAFYGLVIWALCYQIRYGSWK
jgi:hypothetical protein